MVKSKEHIWDARLTLRGVHKIAKALGSVPLSGPAPEVDRVYSGLSLSSIQVSLKSSQ